MVDTETGEFTEKTLNHEGDEVRDFYAALEGRVVVGIEATGSMQWFLELLEELGILCRVAADSARACRRSSGSDCAPFRAGAQARVRTHGARDVCAAGLRLGRRGAGGLVRGRCRDRGRAPVGSPLRDALDGKWRGVSRGVLSRHSAGISGSARVGIWIFRGRVPTPSPATT
jgi:hypothetical protein